ncbi:ParB/RepB/Spo0J family partition protein [Candidatus Peribacteria bacterium]|nr:ParB/RepB/Spo0J family partition protein [Candidatus Peribacteria bacterium]
MASCAATFKELPLDQIEQDPDQPRKDFGVQGADDRLMVSLKEIGIQQPLGVVQTENDRYILIDGHRRHIAARELGMKTAPCRVYSKLQKGELERIRFEIQNNRREWKPLERSEALSRIKEQKGFKTNKELATCLGLSTTLIHFSLELRKQTMEYLGLMEKYDLPDTYRIEFIRLKKHMRRIKDLEISDITIILFEKVKSGVISKAKAFRQLRKIFLRAHLNENEIYDFLKDPDMTVDDLEARTVQSGPSLLVEKLMLELGKMFQEGSDVSEKDASTYEQLRDFLLSKFPLPKNA